MSHETSNINTSFNKEINSKFHQITFQDLIIFKEEILKDLRDYKTKMTKNINNELEKYIGLIEKSNQTMENYETDKKNFMSKIDFTEEKEKLFFELANKNNELKNQVMINQVHISACRKDIDNSCFKYDQIVSDNLLVPGLVGKSCKYQNLKEYILFNKEEINNALFANRQTSNDLNVLRRKLDTTNGQFNTKLKSLEYRISNFITSKFNEVSHKFEMLYDELNKRMAKLTHDINSNIEERNNELAKLKNFVFEENGKAIESVKTIKQEMLTELKLMKKNFSSMKKNIVNLTNLLMGRNFNQNRQNVLTNFNNMMLDLFKEFGLNHHMNNWEQNISSPQKSRMSVQANFISPTNANKKSVVKPNVSSYIKEYIEGKISSSEAKFNHEKGALKRKKSLQLNDKNLISFRNELSQNNQNNINNDNNKQMMKLMKLNSERKEIFPKAIFFDNKRDSIKELNKDINQVKIKPINKKFIKKNTTNYGGFTNKLNNNEIINEEDSNKYLSSYSNISSEENKIGMNEKRKSSINFIKKKSFNMIGNLEERDMKRNTQMKKKSELQLEFIDKKVIEFSISSTSSKKLDNNPEKTNKNVNNIKTEHTNNINFNNNNTSSNIVKTTSNTDNSNNIKIINKYTYDNKNLIINSQNIEIKNKIIKKENENTKKIIDNNIDKNNSFKGLKTEQSININIENKLPNKQINNNINVRINSSENIKQEKIEKFSFLNKNVGINIPNSKKNDDLKDIKVNMNKTENFFYTYNNAKKNEKENPQVLSDKINSIKQRKTSPIIIKSKFTKDNNKIITDPKINDNNKYTSRNEIHPKTAISTKKDLLFEIKRNKKSKEQHEENKKEINEKYSSFDKLNINSKKENHQNKSTGKNLKKILKLNNTTNYFKDDKEIYLSKDLLTSTRYIKDEEIIDKPLLYDTNFFKIDKNKGNLENRIMELEYFTKKKLDELVKEIKIFIPIHFNSHIKNYSLEKN